MFVNVLAGTFGWKPETGVAGRRGAPVGDAATAEREDPPRAAARNAPALATLPAHSTLTADPEEGPSWLPRPLSPARPVRTSPGPDKHAGCYWDVELCGWRRHPSPTAVVPQVPTPRRATA